MEAKILAYHLNCRIDLKHFAHNVERTFKVIKREASFVLLKSSQNEYIYIKEFGSAVFLGCKHELITEILRTLNTENIKIDDSLTEEYILKIDKEKEIDVDFETIYLPEFNDDLAHLLMLNLAQSVALDDFSNQISNLLEETKLYTKQLELKGKIYLSRKNLRFIIGKTLNIKNKIAENLFIFETPNIAWDTENLSQLDAKLKEELEIVDRHNGLQHKIDVVKENLELFKDILQHKHSSILEWIIIVLIFIEIINTIIEKVI